MLFIITSDLNFHAMKTSYCGRTVEKKTILDNSLTSETILRITAKEKQVGTPTKARAGFKKRLP